MSLSIVPNSFWNFPSVRFPSSLFDFDDDNENILAPLSNASGLSVSEDDKNVYVEAALPGIDPKDIEITMDKGMLWIRGETKKEDADDKKKYYKKSVSNFSYRLTVPGEVDPNVEPEATCKNGVMKMIFPKIAKSMPKKIEVKEG